MTMIVAMVRMKENSVTPNTRHAQPKSLPVKTSSASEINIVVMVNLN